MDLLRFFMKFAQFFLSLVVSFNFAFGCCASITVNTTLLNETTAQLLVHVPLEKSDALYTDYIRFSIDNPAVTISEWQSENTVTHQFDPHFNETKQALVADGADCAITLQLEAQAEHLSEIQEAHLQISYYTKSAGAILHENIPLVFFPLAHDSLQTSIAAIDNAPEVEDITEIASCMPVKVDKASSWSEKISNIIVTTDSLALRLLLVLLLGLFMSFTPCIYPMIPITAGILQSQASNSLLRNLLLSLSYTLGIATTFAGLGLVAAYSGQVFGNLFTHPLFILAIVALLAYLAFSMMGFYEMYIPKAFQPKNQKVKQGSLISAFLFGAASGTFASPCLSPGLVLILCIVTSLKNMFLGFLLLFSFGVGLSIPLLIIGSFSSSLSLLPRAGMWMVEVKKFFGIIMLVMCLYFLQYVLPSFAILLLASLLSFATGVWYFTQIKAYDSRTVRIFKNLIGILAIACALPLAFQAYKAYYAPAALECHAQWLTNYEQALEQAKTENKKLIVDVGAPFCSLCKAIDKTLFANSAVKNALCAFVQVKLDGSAAENKAFVQQYSIMGFPAVLIIDPTSQEVIKRWGGELYAKSAEEFISELQ